MELATISIMPEHMKRVGPIESVSTFLAIITAVIATLEEEAAAANAAPASLLQFVSISPSV
jgi:hypothetical protein